MLLIYTQKLTPRINYSFKHICTSILGIPINFTSKIEEFIAYEGMKISYGKQSLGNEIFIQNVDLLLEQGFSDVEVKVQKWDDIPCFFAVSENSSIPYDIFAASFFLLSRYEEYLPHVKDKEGRFPASESLSMQEGFLELPVIDLWALKFQNILQERFPHASFTSRTGRNHNIIAITEAFCYRKKGIVRTVLGFLLDFFQLKVKYVSDRLQVMTGFKRDPYDNYSTLIKFLKRHKVSLKFMFQVSDFSTFDRNLNHNRLEFQSLIKSVADYAEVGLQLGYYANQQLKILKMEKVRLEEILKRPVTSALNSKFNLLLPDTYNNMAELEIKNDYSMGYPEALGFRAGTCTPFLFYDINFEVTTPLLVHSYAIHTRAFENMKESDIARKVNEIKRQTRRAGGELVTIFTNIDFSEYSNAERNYSLLKRINEVA